MHQTCPRPHGRWIDNRNKLDPDPVHSLFAFNKITWTAWIVVIAAASLGLLALGWFLALGLLGGGIFSADLDTALAGAYRFFSWPGLGSSVWLSLWTGVASSVIALWITRHFLALQASSGLSGRCARKLYHLLSPVLAVPHVAFAIGLTLLVWPGGWIARLLSPWASGWERVPDWVVIGDPWGLSLIVGLFLREVPFLLVTALAVGRPLQVQQSIATGQSLGLSATESWHRLVWPQLWPRLRLPFALVLAYGLTNVEMALVLGPNTPPPLAVWTLSLFSDPSPNVFGQVPWAALVLAALTAVVVLGVLHLSDLAVKHEQQRSWRGPWSIRRRLFTKAACGLSLVVGLAIALSLVVGLAASLLFAFSRHWRFPKALPDFSLSTVERLLPDLAMALGQSLALGLSAASLSLVLLVLILERLAAQGWRALPKPWFFGLYAPLIIPQVLVVLALYAGALGLGLSVGWALAFIGHCLFCFCFAALLLAPAWLGFDNDTLAQAKTLGLGPWQRLFQIKAPMMAGALSFAFAMAVTVSLALYLPTLMLGGGRLDTLLTEGVHFAANVRRPQMAVFAAAQTGLSLGILGIMALVPRLVFRNRRGMDLW